MPILSRLPTKMTPCLTLMATVIAILRAIYHIFLCLLAKIPSIQWSAWWTRCRILYKIYFHSVRHAHYNTHVNHAGERNFRSIVRTGPHEVSIVMADGIHTVVDGSFGRLPYYGVVSDFGFVNAISIPSALNN